jgi:ABC-type protease/lipase transport system fused ATPase/permease subunit
VLVIQAGEQKAFGPKEEILRPNVRQIQPVSNEVVPMQTVAKAIAGGAS